MNLSIALPPILGSYTAPCVKRGQRVTCLFRDCVCKITSYTDAPIPWPHVQPLGQRGGSGLWVNTTLSRAIRTESAEAMKHWFGISPTSVWAMRRAFGVGGHRGTRGTRKAHHAACKLGATAMKAKEWTEAERDERSRRAIAAGKRFPNRWADDGWTAAEVALLGTDNDKMIALKIGRTHHAVRSKRRRMGIAAYTIDRHSITRPPAK